MGCGYILVKGPSTEQGVRAPFAPVSGSSSARPSVESILHDQAKLKSELSEVKDALAEEKALNAKRHEDLLALLYALFAKLTLPDNAHWTPLPLVSLSCSLLHFVLPVLSQSMFCFSLFLVH